MGHDPVNLAIHEAAVDTGTGVLFAVTVVSRRGMMKAIRGRDLIAQTMFTRIETITPDKVYRVHTTDGPDWIMERTGGCTACGNSSTNPDDVILRLARYRG